MMIQNSPTPSSFDEHAAHIYKSLLSSLRLRGPLPQSASATEEIPLATIDPLPAYSPSDPRSAIPETMHELFVSLTVIDGMRNAVRDADAEQDAASAARRWLVKRGQTYGEVLQKIVLPRAFIVSLKQKDEILDDLSDFLHHTLYDDEDHLAYQAGIYAAERSIGAFLFLMLCPNFPLIIPTVEVRFLFTKPLLGLTRAIHRVFGTIFLIGFPFFLMMRFATLFDDIARSQVIWVQRSLITRWLSHVPKKQSLIGRYIHHTQARVNHPRRDAILRALLSLVS